MSRARQIIEDMLPGASSPAGDQPNQLAGAGGEAPWKTMTVGAMLAVLPLEVQNKVIEILNHCQGDVSEAARRLKPLFRTHAKALESIGLVADYAAYAIPFAVYNT